ncbi:hypothetical protein JWJ90_09735 [Desulfobulbus rhabdoformis]|jgi:hypothetical protein|uniref:hypothetical protein n=1 Tax=Desulfobulbus rhabdoformis TaxID=34032 RepID=UPI001962B68E|nr:hypothetical protein [Desulfobulbus rhabdoformis]MBM9614570.1 hypothetical protein [Desulfobulbus rhabdoformis]
MQKFELANYLSQQEFTLSKNIGYFPVQKIIFPTQKNRVIIGGILQGEEINSGSFLGKFINYDQIYLSFHWIDKYSSIVVSGKIWGVICKNRHGLIHLFLNWCFISGKNGFGTVSYKELRI